MRLRARTDANHREVITAIRRAGCRVWDTSRVGGGFPDALVAARGNRLVLLEIKDGSKVLAKHWPGVPIYEDVRTLTGNILARDGIGVDVVTGGFPCQDLSVAGRQAGLDGERSGLWSEIVRLTRELQPRYIIVENVANLLSGPSERPGAWFGRVLGDLAECGYDAEWEDIPAAALGAPHRRQRVWLVAYPEQEQRVRPVLNANHGAQVAGAWTPTERDGNGLRSEVGEASGSVLGRWVDQPDPVGVADGVSDWPHRLAACGNSVVPQIPELIGRAILAAMPVAAE